MCLLVCMHMCVIEERASPISPSILCTPQLLAVMYSTFQWESMEKFKEVYLHRK